MSFPHGYALLIGVGSYLHAPVMDEPVTAADAKAVAAVLADPQYCGYPASQVILLCDATATRDGVLTAFDALANTLGEQDTLLVFYCGHGEYSADGSYYLTTYDTQLADGKVVDGSGVRSAELADKLRSVKARRVLFVCNACHAGAVSPVLASGTQSFTGAPLPSHMATALLGTGEGRVIIASCRERQYAFIGPGSLTLFTQALVDGLRGEGVSSQRGYISAFDLYTHLYFALEEAVPRDIPHATRQRYGEQQEPELTVLKGVGPFAVALYRGATAAPSVEITGTPASGTAVREVSPARSSAALAQLLATLLPSQQQTISGSAQTGAAITGGVQGNVAVTQSGDTITGTGAINKPSGPVTQIVGQRNINTGGGRYVERSIDNRSGTFVRGDQLNLSGAVSGSIFNIKATLSSASQTIGALPHLEPTLKDELQQLLERLGVELAKAPASSAREAEAVAEMAKGAVEQATKASPNKRVVQICVEGLSQAAQELAVVLPTVLLIVTRIVEVLQNLVS